jgi:hypothetical protein
VLLLIKKKYILLPIYNSDDVVMSRGNRNFHLRLFVKGGALHKMSRGSPSGLLDFGGNSKKKPGTRRGWLLLLFGLTPFFFSLYFLFALRPTCLGLLDQALLGLKNPTQTQA